MEIIKPIKTRMLFKSDTTKNWEPENIDSENLFIPLIGELCIYTNRIDTGNKNNNNNPIYVSGIKIGNGINDIKTLPFISDDYITDEEIDIIVQNNTLDSFILEKSVLF